MSTRIMTIGNQQITVEEKDMKQAELLFYPENPRVYNFLHAELGNDPSQAEIESHMTSLDHVKELRMSIEANGGLLEPIIVRKGIVLEGNSRLAAYRILSKKDPIKWGMIKCNVLPDDTSEETVASLLGTLHIVGKTPWSPFEQAGFLARSLSKTRKHLAALANEICVPPATAKKLVETYNLMIDNDDAVQGKWSYYEELRKAKEIAKIDEDNPSLGLVEFVKDQIKNDAIPKAQDIRGIDKVCKATGENAQEALDGLLDGTMTIQQAVELVQDDTKLANIQKKVDVFYDFVKKETNNILANKKDPNLSFKIKQLIFLLENSTK